MSDLLRFKPLYQDRVWGGRALQTSLGRPLPADRPIGESWEIVDRPEAQSVVDGGTWDGLALRAVIEKHGAQVMGPQYARTRPFPLLVKWLDCRERLSLQVHPPAEIAPALKGEPKTENWFIAESTPGSGLLVGLSKGTTRGAFAKALVEQTLEKCVHRFPVSAGDSILVRSGTVHAIDAGNLILEIQQNSDTTYRVYDWGRVGLDGKPRQMHVAESLASIDWQLFEPSPVRDSRVEAVIAEAAEFQIRRLPTTAGSDLKFEGGQQPRLVSVVAGKLEVVGGLNAGVQLVKGDNVLLPYSASVIFKTVESGLVLVTENFV